jgi:EAL and modified HD-GYP domain-containing signal transduction protein
MNLSSFETEEKFFISRQPVFDTHKNVFAYKFIIEENNLYMNNLMKHSTDQAISKLIDQLLVNGIKEMAAQKPAFVNFNQKLLIEEIPYFFPSNLLAVVLEGLSKTDETLCDLMQKLKNNGYRLILQHDLLDKTDPALVQYVDIIATDFRHHNLHNIMQQKGIKIPESVLFMAQSVETAADFSEAMRAGFSFFHGEFFAKPDIIAFHDIPSNKISRMQILKEINKPEIEFSQIQKVMERDVALTFKLLSFINSANFGVKTNVQSIAHALNLLGEREVRKWLSIMVLSDIAEEKPGELIKNTIIRAKFCEFLAQAIGHEEDAGNYFLIGMFSMLDAFLDRPMQEILSRLPLNTDVKAALLGESNQYYDALCMVLDYERADWENLNQDLAKINISKDKVIYMYQDAVRWGTYL